jgi:hypothetical protein
MWLSITPPNDVGAGHASPGCDRLVCLVCSVRDDCVVGAVFLELGRDAFAHHCDEFNGWTTGDTARAIRPGASKADCGCCNVGSGGVFALRLAESIVEGLGEKLGLIGLPLVLGRLVISSLVRLPDLEFSLRGWLCIAGDVCGRY